MEVLLDLSSLMELIGIDEMKLAETVLDDLEWEVVVGYFGDDLGSDLTRLGM